MLYIYTVFQLVSIDIPAGCGGPMAPSHSIRAPQRYVWRAATRDFGMAVLSIGVLQSIPIYIPGFHGSWWPLGKKHGLKPLPHLPQTQPSTSLPWIPSGVLWKTMDFLLGVTISRHKETRVHIYTIWIYDNNYTYIRYEYVLYSLFTYIYIYLVIL